MILGDLIDVGPNSKLVMELIMELEKNTPIRLLHF